MKRQFAAAFVPDGSACLRRRLGGTTGVEAVRARELAGSSMRMPVAPPSCISGA